MKYGEKLKQAIRGRRKRTMDLADAERDQRKAYEWRKRRTAALLKVYRRVRDAASLKRYRASRALAHKSREETMRLHDATEASRRKLASWRRKLAEYRRALAARRQPMRLKALRQAESLIGVMEQGGNNRGPMVERIIRANGGMIGEAWCGDFVAFCYRAAGSKAVARAWASVWWLGFGGLAGVQRTTSPKPGDIVIYTFSHTGLFVRDLGDGYIETIEGNTGASGAVSDSATGGDGVYRKRRSKALVSRYMRVTR